MAMRVQCLKVFCDSQLVAYQMLGEYEARAEQIIIYQQVGKKLLEKCEQVYIEQIP